MNKVASKLSAIELANTILKEATNKAKVAKLFAQLAIKLRTTSDMHLRTSMIPRTPELPTECPQQDAYLDQILKSAANRPPASFATKTFKTPLSTANATYGETPDATIRTLLKELATTHNNTSKTFSGRFIDAGSGNGSATVSAALDGRFPRCSGIEYDEYRTELANKLKAAYDNHQSHHHKSTLDFTCGDLATGNLSGASVVFSNSVVWDASLCATMGRRLDEADLAPNGLIVSISRRFPCPSFDLVDILKMPCNGGNEFSFYVCQKHGAQHIVALTDSDTMKGLRNVSGLLQSLISLAMTYGRSNESLAFLAAVAASEPSTRVLASQDDGKVLEMLSEGIRLSINDLSTRASSCMVVRAISDHPVGRRSIAETDSLLTALLESITPKAQNVPSEHPAIVASVLDIIGQLLNDSLGNEKMGSLNIDDHLERIYTDANKEALGDVTQACMEAQSMRRWWAGEQRSVETWFA